MNALKLKTETPFEKYDQNFKWYSIVHEKLFKNMEELSVSFMIYYYIAH